MLVKSKYYLYKPNINMDWRLGIGDWGLGIGENLSLTIF